jgi:hypothetical protein
MFKSCSDKMYPYVLAVTIVSVGAITSYIVSLRKRILNAPTPKRESPGREISILSSNTYLIPWFYVYKLMLEGDKFAINSCTHQHSRAKLVAEIAKTHDVVALQEIWGGATDTLQRRIQTTHNIVKRYRGWEGIFGTGLLGDYVNTLLSHLGENGGLWFASCPSATKELWSYHHTFMNKEGEEFMNKSASFVLLDVSAKWGTNFCLLVINTHLHSPDPFDNTVHREAQRTEISAVLSSLPEQLSKEGITIDWSKCGVLLVGDLNTAFCERGDRDGKIPTTEYKNTLKQFDARDLFLNNASFRPESIGKFSYDGEANQYVSIASRKDSSRMDYALAIDSINQGQIKLLKLKATRCDILDNVDNPCSDHWPISLSVVPE